MRETKSDRVRERGKEVRKDDGDKQKRVNLLKEGNIRKLKEEEGEEWWPG